MTLRIHHAKSGEVFRIDKDDPRITATWANADGNQAFAVVLADGLTQEERNRIAAAIALLDGVIVVETIDCFNENLAADIAKRPS